MKYIFLLKQMGYGCGYTIGCGLNWEVVEADDMDGALEIFTKEYGESYTGDSQLEYLEIVEVSEARHIDEPKFKYQEEEDQEDLYKELINSLNEDQINLLLDVIIGKDYEKMKKYIPEEVLERRQQKALEELINMDWKIKSE